MVHWPLSMLLRHEGFFRSTSLRGAWLQEAMFKQGIPLAAFEVGDIAHEFARLSGQGVAFIRQPTQAGPVTLAIFADTCGNLIQLYQPA